MISSNAHMFSWEEPSNWEIMSKIIMEGVVSVRDFVFQFLKWMMYKRTMDTLVTTLLIVIVILIRMLVKKGRHSSQKANAKSTTNVNLFNNVQLDAADQLQPNYTGIIYPNVVQINKIPNLNESMKLSNWLAMVEFCLKDRHKRDWVGTTITYIDANIISKIKDLGGLIKDDNGFKRLKNELNNIFEKQTMLEIDSDNLKDFKNFFDIKQKVNQTLEQYAEFLKVTIEKLFPLVEFEKLEKMIKRKYVEGLFNRRLQEKCREKLSRTNRNKEPFSFEQLVEYSINKFNGYGIGIESESDNSNQPEVRTVTNNQTTNN